MNQEKPRADIARGFFVFGGEFCPRWFCGMGCDFAKKLLTNRVSGKHSPENRKTGKPENRKTGKPENRKTGKPENRKTGFLEILLPCKTAWPRD
ncbi:hypothetical protein [Sinisalibacter aestuarii]|uniref:hypothetical protein n=1 Tax=Sinisalibacter aestuarii TaxID=2949426 RepID=UPI0024922190|nr:hypothetical protein [Sinisalibacter aestuarii]